MDHLARAVADRLIERYGRPQPVDAGLALRLVGKRAEIHPRDVYASVCALAEAADMFAEANRRYYGHEVYRAPVDGGVLQVVDLRGALVREGCEPTDPSLPDEWRPQPHTA